MEKLLETHVGKVVVLTIGKEFHMEGKLENVAHGIASVARTETLCYIDISKVIEFHLSADQ
jgi:hypothetical protein